MKKVGLGLLALIVASLLFSFVSKESIPFVILYYVILNNLFLQSGDL